MSTPAGVIKEQGIVERPAASSPDDPAPSQIETPGPGDPLKAPAPLQQIRFQVATPGAHRVELRIAQQQGDVRVTVKAGDARLASELRQELPQLVTRLEQAGYQSLRPTGGDPDATTDHFPAREEHSGSSGGSGDQQQGQREPKDFPQPPDRRYDRKEFSWLFSSFE
jgi:hypothetical protein